MRRIIFITCLFLCSSLYPTLAGAPSFAIAEERADAYNNLGNAYFEKGQHDQAISDYNRAAELGFFPR